MINFDELSPIEGSELEQEILILWRGVLYGDKNIRSIAETGLYAAWLCKKRGDIEDDLFTLSEVARYV